MAYKIGTVTNSGGLLAHQNLIALIRQFAGGFGDVGTIGGTRTGTGTLTNVEASPTAITETWTLTCSAAATNSGTFSVVGSVTGNVGNATVGTAFTHSKITFLINDGATDFSVSDTFTIPVTESANPVASRWDVLRYVTTGNWELILKGKGMSGTEEVFVGFSTYESVGADYYNISAATMTGYVAGNTFITQPGFQQSGVPAHNLQVNYWLVVNGQRIALALKVGTPVYESCYVGKMLPNDAPDQFPYPVVCAGMLNGVPATRYSDTTHSMPYKGNVNNMKLRQIDGSYFNAYAWPWTADALTGSTQLRETGSVYTLQPIVLHDNSGTLFGNLDGIFHISGFSNAVENTLSIGGVTYVVIQNVYRTDFNDYYALRLS